MEYPRLILRGVILYIGVKERRIAKMGDEANERVYIMIVTIYK